MMFRNLSHPILYLFIALNWSCSSQEHHKLKVLQFNIWHEGTIVPGGFDAIIDKVIRTNADLIALSEVRNYDDNSLAERLVKALAEKGHTSFVSHFIVNT